MKSLLAVLFLMSVQTFAQEEAVSRHFIIADEIQQESAVLVVDAQASGSMTLYTCLQSEFKAAENDATEVNFSELLKNLSRKRHCKAELELKSEADFNEFFTKVFDYVEDHKNGYEKAERIRLFMSGFVTFTGIGFGEWAIKDKILRVSAEKIATLVSPTATDTYKIRGFKVWESTKNFFRSLGKGFWQKDIAAYKYTYYYSPEALKQAQVISKFTKWKVRGARLGIWGGIAAASYGVIKWSYNVAIKTEASQNADVLVTTIQELQEPQAGYHTNEKKLNLSLLFSALQDMGYENWGDI